jgi:hypothetical protein
VGGGVQIGSTRHVGHSLAYCTCPGRLWGWRVWWNEWQRKPKYSEKICTDATLSTTNPTWPDPGLNPGRRYCQHVLHDHSCSSGACLFSLRFIRGIIFKFVILTKVTGKCPSNDKSIYYTKAIKIYHSQW